MTTPILSTHAPRCPVATPRKSQFPAVTCFPSPHWSRYLFDDLRSPFGLFSVRAESRLSLTDYKSQSLPSQTLFLRDRCFFATRTKRKIIIPTGTRVRATRVVLKSKYVHCPEIWCCWILKRYEREILYGVRYWRASFVFSLADGVYVIPLRRGRLPLDERRFHWMKRNLLLGQGQRSETLLGQSWRKETFIVGTKSKKGNIAGQSRRVETSSQWEKNFVLDEDRVLLTLARQRGGFQR